MRRAFDLDVLRSPRCAGRMQLIATIENPAVIQRLLAHLGLPGTRDNPQPPWSMTAAGSEQPTPSRVTVQAVPEAGAAADACRPVPDDPVEGSHAVIQDPDLTAYPRSGRIGATWDRVYLRCDKADPWGSPSGEVGHD